MQNIELIELTIGYPNDCIALLRTPFVAAIKYIRVTKNKRIIPNSTASVLSEPSKIESQNSPVRYKNPPISMPDEIPSHKLWKNDFLTLSGRFAPMFWLINTLVAVAKDEVNAEAIPSRFVAALLPATAAEPKLLMADCI